MTVLRIVIIFFLFFFVASASSFGATPSPNQYQLAYPGMLPGNPLYFLKSWRDGLSAFFISSPLAKADFYLTQSDKTLHAAYLLDEQNQDNALVLAQAKTSRRLFQESLAQAKAAKKEGLDTTDFLKRLTDAKGKHQEYLILLLKTAPAENKAKWKEEQKQMKGL